MANYRNEILTIGTDTVNVGADFSSLNQKRTSFIITNTSTGGQIITVSVAQEATALNGLVIYPGGSFETTISQGYLPPQMKISAVADVAGATASIYEEAV